VSFQGYFNGQLTDQISEFIVDGTKIPDVHFNIGESYAGLLPISKEKNASELYFWFFPTDNPDGKDDITIWLNVRSFRALSLASTS
jgi:carboxypeptidase D